MCAERADTTQPVFTAGGENKTTKPMKKVEAIIKPFKLEEVKDALGEIGIEA